MSREFIPEESSLLIPDTTDRRYKFVIRNHRKLLKIMKQLQPWQHVQDQWIVVRTQHWCGTAACALGWAVLSGEFKGLSYGLKPGVTKLNNDKDIIPIAQGYNLEDFEKEFARMAAIMDARTGYSAYSTLAERGPWGCVGIAWFGEDSVDEIFGVGDLTTLTVIDHLEDRIEQLQWMLAKTAPENRYIL